MRSYFIAFLLLLVLSPVASMAQDEADYRSPETWLLGFFEPDYLLYEPHDAWYNKQFDNYQVDPEALEELISAGMEGLEILVVLGTWCPDSRREVPRFMKIASLCGIDQDLIKMLGTDSYKIAPVDDYDELGIERVPTFIFYRNKVEVGRIIEYPVTSLERDMVEILKN